MNSSDEDFLPDPERPRKRGKPPDRDKTSGSQKKKTLDEPANQQSGLYLCDDSKKGRCSFSTMCNSFYMFPHKVVKTHKKSKYQNLLAERVSWFTESLGNTLFLIFYGGNNEKFGNM